MSTSSSEAPKLNRMPSGIAGLDTILGGGFMLGGMYMIEGRPGAGKTILTNQICFNHAASGGKALFVTLLAENHARMMSHISELSFYDQDQIPDKLTYLGSGLIEATRRGRLRRCRWRT